MIIKGKTAENIFSKIEKMKLLTRLDHAAYLGRELAKAEILQESPARYNLEQIEEASRKATALVTQILSFCRQTEQKERR